MTNLKKVFMAVLIGALIISLCSIVFASDGFQVIPDGSTTPDTTNNTNNVVENNVVNEPTVINPADQLGTTNINNNTNNTSTYNNNTNNLPKTGVGDYTMVTAMILLVIVAVYAYKKVKDYKNI